MVSNKIIAYNQNLCFNAKLPLGFFVLNPIKENSEVLSIIRAFYTKFYKDTKKRKFILGINPGRHGAGITGIPFTDTKRLEKYCGIAMEHAQSHEISSVFVYEMIEKYGGVHLFYKNYFINSPFPFVILRKKPKGSFVNANYYDDPLLYASLKDYMIENLKIQISLGLETDEVYIWGKKNAHYIKKMNKEATLFKKIIVLEHPRYIQQYKNKEKEFYFKKYLEVL